ncbi:MAG: preprotein translocase subunit YajC [Deltaproteobacteria bacterium]|nr:preprotein translocase subunit YajC [Deltaproteobacteria bacterium]
MLYFFPAAIANAEDGLGGIASAFGGLSSTLGGFLPFIVLILIFYFLLIRPQQKSAKQHAEMLRKIADGDNVVTRGGLYGRVVNVKEDALTLEIASNVRVKVDRNAIQTVKGKESSQ